MKIKHLITGIALSLTMVFGVGAGLINNGGEVKEVKAESSTAGAEIFIGVYDNLNGDGTGWNYFNESNKKAMLWVWGSFTSCAKDITLIGSHLGVCVLPTGTTGFKMFRTWSSFADGSPDFPTDGNVWDQSGDIGYTSAHNTVVVSGWNTANLNGDLDIHKISAGTTITVNAADCDIDWFGDNAVFYFTTYGDYNLNYTWTRMERVVTNYGNTSYIRGVTTQDFYAKGIIFTRNDPKGTQSSWNSRWNESTGIPYSKVHDGGLYGFVSGKDGEGHYNIGYVETSNYTAYAEMFGAIFLSKATCDDNGSYTFASSTWTALDREFDNLLSANARNVFATSTGAIDGATFVLKAVYRYDYMLFKKHYNLDEFMSRTNSANRLFKNINMTQYVNSDNTALIIIVISSIGLISLGGLLIFKKKKEY